MGDLGGTDYGFTNLKGLRTLDCEWPGREAANSQKTGRKTD